MDDPQVSTSFPKLTFPKFCVYKKNVNVHHKRERCTELKLWSCCILPNVIVCNTNIQCSKGVLRWYSSILRMWKDGLIEFSKWGSNISKYKASHGELRSGGWFAKCVCIAQLLSSSLILSGFGPNFQQV